MCHRNIAADKKKAVEEIEGEKSLTGKLRQSWRGLSGHGGMKEHSCSTLRKRVRFADEMSGYSDSSSKASESSEEAIVASMLNLAIACTHVQQQATSKAVVAGNLASHSFVFNLGFLKLSFVC